APTCSGASAATPKRGWRTRRRSPAPRTQPSATSCSGAVGPLPTRKGGRNMSTEIPPGGRKPGGAETLQILATEHWSMLATRALTYNEALSRVTIFLAILSGALIALALVAQADHFGAIFIWIAIPMLALVIFTGLATISRLTVLNGDDYRWVIGMNRLRHAYVDLHPELEQYFITRDRKSV